MAYIFGAPAGAAPLLPILVPAAADINYSFDPIRPELICRAAMTYPQAVIADCEATTQGLTVSNPAAGALSMGATGGLNPGVDRGYYRLTPTVGTPAGWDSATRTSERPYRDYAPRNSVSANPLDDQYWIVGLRKPTTTTPVNDRMISLIASQSDLEASTGRCGLRCYNAGVYDLYADGNALAPVVIAGGVPAIAESVLWIRLYRAAASRTPIFSYSVAGGTSPPTSWSAVGTMTNMLGAVTSTLRVGFACAYGADTATAFSGDIVYFDDSLALPRMDAIQLGRYVQGLDTVPTPAFGFAPTQPERVIANGPCAETMTQAKLRAILAASENTRVGLDTASWEWKAERYPDGGAPSGGSFSSASTLVVAGTGGNIRVTVRPEASGTKWGSLHMGVLVGWSPA